LKDKIASALELIVKSDLEGAKKQIADMAQTAKSERDRGSLMALSGILASISRGKEGTMQTWEPEKMSRAAVTVRKSQMADDWDRGYADVLTNYSKLAQKGK
jgi:hypothetical protein